MNTMEPTRTYGYPSIQHYTNKLIEHTSNHGNIDKYSNNATNNHTPYPCQLYNLLCGYAHLLHRCYLAHWSTNGPRSRSSYCPQKLQPLCAKNMSFAIEIRISNSQGIQENEAATVQQNTLTKHHVEHSQTALSYFKGKLHVPIIKDNRDNVERHASILNGVYISLTGYNPISFFSFVSEIVICTTQGCTMRMTYIHTRTPLSQSDCFKPCIFTNLHDSL